MAGNTDFHAALKTLQVRLVDAVNGYEEGASLTESAHMKQVFHDLAAAHRTDADAISAMLLERGETPDKDGSWFTLVHEAIMNVRSLVTGLGEDTLQPIADGERRIEKLYDAAIEAADPADRDLGALREKRARVAARAAELEADARAKSA